MLSKNPNQPSKIINSCELKNTMKTTMLKTSMLETIFKKLKKLGAKQLQI